MLFLDPKYPIVDSHRHLLEPEIHEWVKDVKVLRYGHVLETLEQNSRAAGVSLVVPVEANGLELENEYLFSQAGRSDLIQRVVGWLPLDAPDLKETLASAPETLAGVRVVGNQDGVGYYDDAAHQRGINEVLASGRTFDVLLETEYQEMIRTLLPAIGGGDNCSRIVFDHYAFKERVRNSGPSDEWRRRSEWCANFGNKEARVKASAWWPEGQGGFRAEWTFPYFRHLLDVFGPDRIMWGSDDPIETSPGPCKWVDESNGLHPTACYDDMLNIPFAWFLADGIEESIQAKIMGTNAANFYGLTL